MTHHSSKTHFSGKAPKRIAVIVLLVLLCSCAESFVGSPLSANPDDTGSMTPQPSFSDGFSNNTLALQRSLELSWPASTSAFTSWCVSESQTSLPVLECDGGQGPDGGWSTNAPETFTLSAGNGTKLLYTWVRDATGTLIPVPSVTGIPFYGAAALIPLNESSGSLVQNLLGGSFFFHMGLTGTWGTRSLHFDGISAHVDLGVPEGLRLESSFTLSTWVKSIQPGGQILLGRYDPGAAKRSYALYFTSTALILEVSKDGSTGSGNFARLSAPYAALGFQNRWKHIVAVYDTSSSPARLSLYIDTIKVEETTVAPSSLFNPSDLKVTWGISSDTASFPLRGQVGATAILPTALPANLIPALYSGHKSFYP